MDLDARTEFSPWVTGQLIIHVTFTFSLAASRDSSSCLSLQILSNGTDKIIQFSWGLKLWNSSQSSSLERVVTHQLLIHNHGSGSPPVDLGPHLSVAADSDCWEKKCGVVKSEGNLLVFQGWGTPHSPYLDQQHDFRESKASQIVARKGKKIHGCVSSCTATRFAGPDHYFRFEWCSFAWCATRQILSLCCSSFFVFFPTTTARLCKDFFLVCAKWCSFETIVRNMVLMLQCFLGGLFRSNHSKTIVFTFHGIGLHACVWRTGGTSVTTAHNTPVDNWRPGQAAESEAQLQSKLVDIRIRFHRQLLVCFRAHHHKHKFEALKERKKHAWDRLCEKEWLGDRSLLFNLHNSRLTMIVTLCLELTGFDFLRAKPYFTSFWQLTGAMSNRYTHYFYNVMKASYSFRSWDVNGVPIAMFFATHFYFTLYFTLSNMTLHKVGRLPLPPPCNRFRRLSRTV